MKFKCAFWLIEANRSSPLHLYCSILTKTRFGALLCFVLFCQRSVLISKCCICWQKPVFEKETRCFCPFQLLTYIKVRFSCYTFV
uniref:Uncharacterized protein n=1 Tax=Setaria italica TaxID=4555 RepID=K3YB93_SETIT